MAAMPSWIRAWFWCCSPPRPPGGFLGAGTGTARMSWFGAGAGLALGVGAAAVPIAVAHWRGRRWPLYPGDAMMLGAFGFLLGPLGLAWTMLLGSAFALLHRLCLQRRRGRPFRKGLVPLGPGMTAGAAVVFLCLNFGVALAGDQDAPKGMALPATELVPGFAALPGELARREVSLEQSEAVPFRALVRRLSSLTGVTMAIEERPARVAGGTAILADPPPLRLAWRGPLAGLLDHVAALSGYDWSWTGGAVVFHRYWDVEQRFPDASAAGTAEAGTDADGTAGRAAAEESWVVDPAGHRTLRGVLDSWAAPRGLDTGLECRTRLWPRRGSGFPGRVPGGGGSAAERPRHPPLPGGARLHGEPPIWSLSTPVGPDHEDLGRTGAALRRGGFRLRHAGAGASGGGCAGAARSGRGAPDRGSAPRRAGAGGAGGHAAGARLRGRDAAPWTRFPPRSGAR